MAKGRKGARLTRPPKPKKKRPKPPQDFTYNYEPDVLEHVGPMFIAGWSVPEALAAKLLEEGKLVPEPIFGAILLDTGATATCISQRVAEALGLPVTRIARGYGAGGRHENPVYLARLHVRITDPLGSLTHIQMEKEVRGIPDLDQFARSVVGQFEVSCDPIA